MNNQLGQFVVFEIDKEVPLEQLFVLANSWIERHEAEIISWEFIDRRKEGSALILYFTNPAVKKTVGFNVPLHR